MLFSSATFCVNKISKYYYIEDNQKPIYIYGFELLFSSILSLLSITIMSILFHRYIFSVSFILAFYIPRLFCGGVHATTYNKCYIITNTIFIIICALTQLLLYFKLSFMAPIISLLSFIIILFLSPITNLNHPCSIKTINRNKYISKILSILLNIIIDILFVLQHFNPFVCCSSICLLAVSILLIIEKLRKGGQTNGNNLHDDS